MICFDAFLEQLLFIRELGCCFYEYFMALYCWIFSGVTASMGLGGGFILLIYLTFFTAIPQLESQLMNLIFFIPISILSIILHLRNHLIEKKVLLQSIIMGILGVILGSFLSAFVPEELLSKLFGGFILLVGIKELFHKKTEKRKPYK